MYHARVVGLVAALALSVAMLAGVSSASAALTAFHSETTETTLDGEMVEGATNPAVFETAAGTISCASGSAMATMTGTTATQIETSLPSGTASGIAYENCTFLGFINVNVNMGTCQYNFHINGEVDITPSEPSPGCGPIRFEAAGCVVSVGSQPGLTSVSYANMGTKKERDVTILPNITNIKYSTGKGCLNGAHEGLTGGKYHGGTFTVKGTHPAGTQVGVWVE
jgi:hypothetical protein